MWFWELFAKVILALIYGKTKVFEQDGVTYIVVSRFRRKGIAGQAWGRVIFIREDKLKDERLKKHELVHVKQWYKYGFWFPFVYSAETVRAGWVNGWKNAYHMNRFEIEARDLSKY